MWIGNVYRSERQSIGSKGTRGIMKGRMYQGKLSFDTRKAFKMRVYKLFVAAERGIAARATQGWGVTLTWLLSIGLLRVPKNFALVGASAKFFWAGIYKPQISLAARMPAVALLGREEVAIWRCCWRAPSIHINSGCLYRASAPPIDKILHWYKCEWYFLIKRVEESDKLRRRCTADNALRL